VDRKRVREVAGELAQLVARTREGKATLEELRGGTFTVTNTGALGGTGATPIINYPEVAILGVGRAREMPVVRDGQVVVRLLLPLSCPCDQRVIEGRGAARFGADLVRLLGAPERLRLEAGADGVPADGDGGPAARGGPRRHRRRARGLRRRVPRGRSRAGH